MTKIIHFPAEQTREAIVDRAIAHAEKVLRLARLSDRRAHLEFRRDQVQR